jgi:hypothetical protein
MSQEDFDSVADHLDAPPEPPPQGFDAAAEHLESPPADGGMITAESIRAGRRKPGHQYAAEPEETEGGPFSPLLLSRALVGEFGRNPAAAAVAGWHGLFSTPEEAAANVEKTQGELGYTPTTPMEKAVVGATQSPYNPLNWPDVAGQYAGEKAAELGAPAAVSTALRVGPDALMAALGLKPGRAGALVKEAGERPPAEVSRGTIPEEVPPTTFREGKPIPDVPETFEEAPMAKPGGELPLPEQARRQRVLNEIGLTKDVPYRRNNVLRGDPMGSGTDAQIAKFDTPEGRYMKGLFENERGKLTEYSEGTIEQTGGRAGNTQSDTIARGESVISPLEKLSEQFDKKRRELYTTADERAGGAPVSLKGFQDVLGDDSVMTTNPDRVGLRSGVTAYLKKLGAIGEDGSVNLSPKKAESVRKYLNQEWSPKNSGAVRQLKAAIDEDVSKAAGEDVYKEARASKTEQARTLEEPKGIAELLDASGPEGMNRKVASDNVMTKLETMPPEQFRHVMDVLRGMKGGALEGAGKEAVANVQAHFAQRVHDLGTSQVVQWNGKAVNQYLRNNSEQLKIAFEDNPEGLRRLQTANEAGKILRYDASYPGAAAQATNVMRSGTLAPYAQHAATWIGGALGGFFGGGPLGAGAGAAIGERVGGKAAAKLSERAARKAVENRAQYEVPEEPQ